MSHPPLTSSLGKNCDPSASLCSQGSQCSWSIPVHPCASSASQCYQGCMVVLEHPCVSRAPRAPRAPGAPGASQCIPGIPEHPGAGNNSLPQQRTPKPALSPLPAARRPASSPTRPGRTIMVGLDMGVEAGAHRGADPMSPVLSAGMSHGSALSCSHGGAPWQRSPVAAVPGRSLRSSRKAVVKPQSESSPPGWLPPGWCGRRRVGLRGESGAGVLQPGPLPLSPGRSAGRGCEGPR